MIPLSIPEISGNEWKYVKECLDTGWVSSAGPFVNRFEQEIARYTGAGHGVAVVNGTAGLQLALLLAGVKPGDVVLVPSLTFIAPINAVRYVGAEPVFLDCDDYYNLAPEALERFLDDACMTRVNECVMKDSGRRVAAVIAVHVFGNAADLERMLPLCRQHGIPLIEDATESLGTRYAQGDLAGKHTGAVGDFGVLSFNGNKVITTGGGGMLLTADDGAAARARYLSTQAKDDPVRYVHDEVGYNWRLTNVQAAIGVAQLEQLDRFVAQRRSHHARYTELLAGVPGLEVAGVPSYAENNCWLTAIRIDASRYGRDRERTMEHLRKSGVESRPVWHLNHQQAPYRGCRAWNVSRAVELWQRTLNLPSSAGLSGSDLDKVVEALKG
ncbi:MAG: LegC family aminotransferase [Deltaproteobacteria bacterium]|nr:LegC family aminotransferase [Deltaproteobacteria bacterium]